jgi:hypothetical protein
MVRPQEQIDKKVIQRELVKSLLKKFIWASNVGS